MERKGKRATRGQPRQRRTTFEARITGPEVPTSPKSVLNIVSKDGTVIYEQQSPVEKTTVRSQNTPSINRPVYKPIELQLSNEALQNAERRKKALTYTIDDIKKMRHNDELSADNVFKFHAELQLYKRYLDGRRQKKPNRHPADAAVLQHRINTILNRFSSHTYSTVFKNILELGIDSDIFILSYVNVVFKQAVLNPSMSSLFSSLTSNLIYVMKHTRSADKMRSLLKDRINESFVTVTPQTDKGVKILVEGIIKFAHFLLEDGAINQNDLRKDIVKALNESTKQEPEPEPVEKNVRFEELDHMYPSLFVRSDSVPVGLDDLAFSDVSLENAIMSYVRSSEFADIEAALMDLEYNKLEQRTANDLIRAIAESEEQYQIVASRIASEAVKYEIIDAAMLKAAIKNVAHTSPNNEKIGNNLVRIFVHVVSEEYANLDDFEWLFVDLSPIWKSIIPTLIFEAEQVIGSFSDELMLSNFWKDAKFLGDAKLDEKIKYLKELDIIEHFPHYDAVSKFSNAFLSGEDTTEAVSNLVSSANRMECSQAIAELLLTMDEAKRAEAMVKLAPFINSNMGRIITSLNHLGDAGKALAKKLK